tara:strand:- start:177 stop:896 length:720 start_codon:yes stop_codon:yes gene_type:complete
MGGESSGPSDSDFGRLSGSNRRDKAMAEATNRAKEEQERKSRQIAFDQGGTMGRESPEYKMRSGSGVFREVDQNVRIARDLEQRAKSSEVKVPVPTIGTVALGTISSVSRNQQAKALRSGGRAVFDASVDPSSPMFDAVRDYRGVVSTNSLGVSTFSGDPDFSPIGRRDGVTRTDMGSYSVSRRDSTQGSDNPSEMIVAPPANDVTEPIKKPTTPSISTASRRALIAGAGGGATRRNLL